MAGKSTNRLRLESLEDRWNQCTLQPLALAAPALEPATVGGLTIYATQTDYTLPSSDGESAIVVKPTVPASPVASPDTIYIQITDWADASIRGGDILTGSDIEGEPAPEVKPSATNGTIKIYCAPGDPSNPSSGGESTIVVKPTVPASRGGDQQEYMTIKFADLLVTS